MKLKTKPKKPIRNKSCRKNLVDLCYSGDFEGPVIDLIHTLQGYVDKYKNEDGDVFIEAEQNWDDPDGHQLVYKGLEPLEDFEQRQENYKKRKATYDKWYEENKDAIEKEIQSRKEKDEAKFRKDSLRRQEQEKKELARLEKKYRNK